MKYVAPIYLLVVLFGFIFTDLPAKAVALRGNPVALWTGIIIGVVIALLIGMVAVGERRWRAAGLDPDDERRERA